MGSDGVFPKPLSQVERNALGQLPSIDEDERGAVLQDEFSDAVVDLVPHLVRSDGSERDSRDLDGEIELALVTDVYDHRVRTAAAGKEMRDLLDGLLRRREPNTVRALLSQQFQPFE